jgi:hypothetical protein
MAALVAVIVRLRGSGGTPPHRGGWHQLSVSDLEPTDIEPTSPEPTDREPTSPEPMDREPTSPEPMDRA